MADLEFYKTALDSFCNFIQEQIHPWYGPCDGFSDGDCSACLQVLEALKAAHALVNVADRIETEDGHLVQRSGRIWYAYPKLDPESPGDGGEVIYAEGKKLKPFNSAGEAYAACVEARAQYTQAASARNGDASRASETGGVSP
jgi:hypothetical protein